jgi:hypothetical protein
LILIFAFWNGFLGFIPLLQVTLSVYFWEGNFDNSGGMTDILFLCMESENIVLAEFESSQNAAKSNAKNNISLQVNHY